MKEVPFSLNTNNCSYDYMRVREGPNWFRCYYKNVSRKIIEPLDAWRTLGVAKHTDFGKALKAWCLEMNETYSTESRLGVTKILRSLQMLKMPRQMNILK